MAARATAHDPAIAGLVLISPWDIGKDGAAFSSPAARKAAAKDEFDDDVIPLAGTSTDKLMDEALANAKAWEFVGYAPALRTRPVLLVTADDGNGPDSHRLAEAMQKLGNKAVIETHFATDHPYSDHRIALASAVVGWLQRR